MSIYTSGQRSHVQSLQYVFKAICVVLPQYAEGISRRDRRIRDAWLRAVDWSGKQTKDANPSLRSWPGIGRIARDASRIPNPASSGFSPQFLVRPRSCRLKGSGLVLLVSCSWMRGKGLWLLKGMHDPMFQGRSNRRPFIPALGRNTPPSRDISEWSFTSCFCRLPPLPWMGLPSPRGTGCPSASPVCRRMRRAPLTVRCRPARGAGAAS
jgi:hypothetical protein